MQIRLILLVIGLSFVEFGQSAKVLVFNSKFAYAHTQFMGILADTLYDGGLDTTVLVSEVDNQLRSNGSKKAKMIFLEVGPEAAKAMRFQHEHDFIKNIWVIDNKAAGMIQGVREALTAFLVPQCKYILEQDELLEKLRNEKFDIGVTETMDICGIGLFHALGIKRIVSGSTMTLYEGTANLIGQPLMPSHIPGSMSPVDDHMSFADRVLNWMFVLGSIHTTNHLAKVEGALFKKKYGDNFPDLEDLIASSELVFHNYLPYFDDPRPSLPKVLNIGGITMRVANTLNNYWIEVLSRRDKTFLVSFGSVLGCSKMPEAYQKTLLDVIKSIPDVTFILRHDDPNDDHLKNISNLVISDWMPQNDLLARPEVVGFLSHGGANSIMEAVVNAKPLLVIPMFVDQTRLASIVDRKHIGRMLHKTDLAKFDKLRGAIVEVVENESIRLKSERFARLLKRVDHRPKEVLVNHIKLLAEFGSLPELDSVVRHLPWYQYWSLDILGVILLGCTCLCVFMFILTKVLLKLLRLVFSIKIKVE